MFYNGFNLLIDMLIAGMVWFFVRYHYKGYEYSKGMFETIQAIESGDIKKDGNRWFIPCDTGGFIEMDFSHLVEESK